MKKILLILCLLSAACASSEIHVKGKIEKDERTIYFLNKPYGNDVGTLSSNSNAYSANYSNSNFYNQNTNQVVSIFNPIEYLMQTIRDKLLVQGWSVSENPNLARYHLAISASNSILMSYGLATPGYQYEISIFDKKTNKMIFLIEGLETARNVSKKLVQNLNMITR